nr:hypothetical protein [Niabella agricola]
MLSEAVAMMGNLLTHFQNHKVLETDQTPAGMIVSHDVLFDCGYIQKLCLLQTRFWKVPHNLFAMQIFRV